MHPFCNAALCWSTILYTGSIAQPADVLLAEVCTTHPAPFSCLLAAAQEVDQLWQEYEQQSTPEAHLVKDFDKLEMIMQAHEYEQSQGLGLQQFFDSTRGRFRTDTG
eukprot:GHRQ01016850.1.p4 GENE.GHRQ01016850.1~~GHRQ01016850.1.p4  ORF type:complete len:107 (-),score=36.04 GHRQ01016850.1:372-692(-)